MTDTGEQGRTNEQTRVIQDAKPQASVGEERRLEAQGAAAIPTSGAVAAPASSLPGPELLEELWGPLQEAILRRVKPEQFETWFRRAALTGLDETQVTIATQNKFSRDWLESYYRDVLEEAVEAVLGVRREISLVVDAELTVSALPARSQGSPAPDQHEASAPGASPASAEPSIPQRVAEAVQGSAIASSSTPKRPGLLHSSDVVLNPKYTFENFVVGPCNRFPHAAAMGAAEAPGKVYNPFFCHGNVGLGKTHLLQSICSSVLDRWADTRILYLSCETFVNHFINALENGDLEKFRTKYRNVDVLVVDDIHLLANKERTQEEFFHTFNTLYNAGKQIVLSSDSPPMDIPTLQDRLVSRFKWGLVTEILPPCYETRVAIVKRKSRERMAELPDDVAKLIAEHVQENVRELEGAVTKLIGYANLTGQKVSVQLAREALREAFAVRKGAPTMDDVVRVVTAHYGTKLSDLQSRRRNQSVAYPRQVAMYLARKITRHSLEEIGRYFGGRDHSTVLYAIDKISKLSKKDPAVHAQLEEFLERLSM